MAFIYPAAIPFTRHLGRLPVQPPRPIVLSRSLCVASQQNSTSHQSQHARSSNNVNATSASSNSSETASESPPSSARGFQLLQQDISRLGRLMRGDFSMLIDRSFSLYRYDPDAIARYYDARPVSAFLRVSSIGVPFLLWLFNVRRVDRWLGRSGRPDITSRRADQLRRLLTWAGPTYLKIGQAVGNRPDLVGLVYSSELQKLVDNVGTFDSDVALKMVTNDLNLSDLSDAFDYFDRDAMASASLGQVHRARLKSGEEVAVKVQRPTVERDAALDVYVLRRVALFLKRRFKLRSDVVGIVDEFANRLWEELDYVNEADNCEKFGRLYSENNPDVYVPKVYRNLTSKRILCMEWIEGDKAPWYPQEEAQRLISVGVQCSLEQLLNKGFVHADPHGGNLLRTKDRKLCYLDFGMCVQVSDETRYDLVAAIVRLINRDFENLAEDFVKLGFLPPDVDRTPFAPLLVKAFGDASTGSNLSDLSFSKLTDNLSGLAFATPIRIPVFFTLIIRSLTILEGFALQTDAAFKIVDESYPYVVKRILTDNSPVFQQALEDILLEKDTGRLRWDRLNSLLATKSDSVPDGHTQADREKMPHAKTPKRTRSTEDAFSEVSDRALTRVLDFTLSERGKFLREAIFLELADTADAAQLAVAQRVSELSNGVLPPPSVKPDLDRLANALRLAEALRIRAPELLNTRSGTRGQVDQQTAKRLQLLGDQLGEGYRKIAADVLERNSKRILRRAITALFGPPQRE